MKRISKYDLIMDYEKKYKETLERAKKVYHRGYYISGDIDSIFPELKESEDERIKNVLIGWINLEPSTSFNDTFDGFSKEQILAWLEKQDKKELVNFDEAEKEKADFVGDGFIKCFANFSDFKEGNTYWLEYIGDDKYNVRSDNLLGKTYHITPCQLYTVFKKQTWLEKQGQVKESQTIHPIFTFEDVLALECSIKTAKITKGGDELYKILVPLYNKIHNAYLAEKQGEQKPAWSEEDDRMLHTIIADFNGFSHNNTSTLESHFNECIDWLKSLKDRVVCEANCTATKEWSEDDKNRFTNLISLVKNASKAGFMEFINKLKSLEPQSTWKPSDGQMEALESATENCAYSEYQDCLRELIVQLKKLKKE